MGNVWLVLGGARSGKTARALALAGACPVPVYIATAEARDDEMQVRIARHRAERGKGWSTREVPLELCEALRAADGPEQGILVDCLTLWLSNLMEAGRPVEAETEKLVAVLQTLSATIVLVSNEVGSGIVPDNALARSFRDAQGRLNQAVAAIASDVELVVAGLSLKLK